MTALSMGRSGQWAVLGLRKGRGATTQTGGRELYRCGDRTASGFAGHRLVAADEMAYIGVLEAKMRMSRMVALSVGVGALAAVACQKVAHTNRLQLVLIPSSVMKGVGKSSYSSMLGEVRVKKKGPDNEVLQKVGDRISRAAAQPDYDWQYSLIQSDEVNAWCLPGGYIGVYNGILPVLESESGMAFVMGHEVAHATAHHGAERMSQQLALVGGLAGLELFMANATELEPEKRLIILGALGVGGTLGVLLPFSRKHESEADTIGMMYMARAGYPPAESKAVWDRMATLSPSSNAMPAFMSTHPSHDQRKANLDEWLPAARKKYQRNKLARDTQSRLWQ